jgi:ketosteroid isomerase-like protein
MRIEAFVLAASSMACVGCSTLPERPDTAALAQQVAATERGFAKSMADRDHAAFSSFLSEEAIFFTTTKPLRGKDQVAAGWKRFFEGAKAPFSWAPDSVEVLDSGTLALSSGPVHDPSGKRIGTFISVWRQEAPGVWRIVLDKGCKECACEQR